MGSRATQFSRTIFAEGHQHHADGFLVFQNRPLDMRSK